MCVSGALQAKMQQCLWEEKAAFRREMEEGLHAGGVAVKGGKVWVGQAVREHRGREMALGEA